MGIGGSIGLFALGAILTFAVNWHVKGMDVHVVGIVLMFAGLLGLITIGAVFGRRRRLARGEFADEIVTERRTLD
ncbi:DUF6458 family protein [Streptacidiphilus monticola]|uniref:DUF6458 family protein n=1 Tax=Streptacidiphilus monticola TaxID=2161674 RepID=A0ABW1G8S1_9ACTN